MVYAAAAGNAAGPVPAPLLKKNFRVTELKDHLLNKNPDALKQLYQSGAACAVSERKGLSRIPFARFVEIIPVQVYRCG